MNNPVYSTTAPDIIEKVEHYRRAPDPVTHESLLPLIREVFGADAAEFFDQEGQLPLTSTGLPWPMRQYEARLYTYAILAVSTIGTIAVTAVLLRTSPPLQIAALLAAASGIILWYATPILARIAHVPKDITERRRLVAVYDEIRHNSAAVAAQQALRARRARRASRRQEHTTDSSNEGSSE